MLRRTFLKAAAAVAAGLMLPVKALAVSPIFTLGTTDGVKRAPLFHATGLRIDRGPTAYTIRADRLTIVNAQVREWLLDDKGVLIGDPVYVCNEYGAYSETLKLRSVKLRSVKLLSYRTTNNTALADVVIHADLKS